MSVTNFRSGRLAPATTRPSGTPWPSVTRLRLTPLLARSVGLGPVFFPPARGLRHCSVPAQPLPVDPLQLVKLFHSGLPQLQKDPGLYPFLKAIMGSGTATQVRGVQRPPLTPRAQDIENGLRALPIGDPRPPAPKPMAVDVHGPQGLEDRPEFIRNPVAGRDVIHRRPGPSPFLCFWRFHTLESTRSELFG